MLWRDPANGGDNSYERSDKSRLALLTNEAFAGLEGRSRTTVRKQNSAAL